MKTSDLTRVALLLALLIVSSQFALPIGPVPVTLQTLIILIIGLLLPTEQAMLTTSLYLVLGLLGLPIFTQAMGGPHAVLLPSFGFILSFTPAVWGMSKIREWQPMGEMGSYVLAVIIGNSIIYIIGITYMTFIFLYYLGNEMTLWKIISIGMLPFIPGDILKSILAISIARQLNSHLSVR